MYVGQTQKSGNEMLKQQSWLFAQRTASEGWGHSLEEVLQKSIIDKYIEKLQLRIIPRNKYATIILLLDPRYESVNLTRTVRSHLNPWFCT